MDGTISVLVVDDDPDVCEFLVDFLTAEGFKPSIATSPENALEQIRTGEFHVVILDLMMPRISGLELLPEIRAIDDDISIVVLTGFPTLETATAVIDYEISAYLRKPLATEAFRQAITRIAKRKGLSLRREDELHRTIGRAIRDMRRGRALTLKQLARRTGLSVSLLSQIERAESSASVSTLWKVASALDVRVTELFGPY